MLAAILAVFLFFPQTVASPGEANRCEPLRAAAEAAFHAIDEDRPETAHTFLTHAEHARSCLEDHAPETTRWFFYREIYVLQKLTEHQQALRRLEAFIDFTERHPDPDAQWWLYVTYGNLHYYLGNLNAAAGSYARALTALDDMPLDRQAKLFFDFGNVQQRLHDLDAARRYYHRGTALVDSLDSSHPNWLDLRTRSFNARADLLILEAHNAPKGAADSLQKAVALLRKSLALLASADLEERMIQAQLILGEGLLELEAYDEARRPLERALTLSQRAGNGHYQFLSLYRLGLLHLRGGATNQAERWFAQAHALIDQARHIDYRRFFLQDMGLLYEVTGDAQQAEQFYLRSMALAERYRQSLRSTEWSALAFSDWQQAHRGRVRVLLAQDRTEQAFRAMEETRARHLQDLHMQMRGLGQRSRADSLRFDSLTTVLSETLNALFADTLSTSTRRALEARQARLTAERRTLLNLGEQAPLPAMATLQRELARHNQVLLSYFIDTRSAEVEANQRPLRSHVFLLTPDTLVAASLKTCNEDLSALLAQVSPVLPGAPQASGLNTMMFSLDALKQLYNVVMAPVAAHIPDDARLVVVPDGPLFTLPFGMLVEEETEPYAYQTASYLIRKHPITVELAATLLLHEALSRPAPTYDVVAFGKTHFTERDAPEAPRLASERSDALPSLPGATKEVASLMDRFPRSRSRLGSEATEAAFFDLAPEAQVVHVASHTLAGDPASQRNAIVLSTGPEPDGSDGILYVHEIQRQPLTANLVVLSGCSTARGVLHPGEGMAGLHYAFRAMGVPSTLATTWLVDDAASLTLMDAFYRHLQQGQPKDMALQTAQLDYLSQAHSRHASPFFWAAPVLYGNPAPLSFSSSQFPWTLLLLMVVLAALVALLVWRYGVHPRSSTS